MSDRDDSDVFIFPDAHPIRSGFQFRVRRVCTRDAGTGELHATRMQDEAATVDEERVAIQSVTRHFHAFRAVTALDGRTIQIGVAHAERAVAEQVGCINQTIGRARARRTAIVHDDATALERLDLRFALTVRDEVNQVELPQRGLACSRRKPSASSKRCETDR